MKRNYIINKIFELEKRIARLEKLINLNYEKPVDIFSALNQRGLHIKSYNPKSRLFFPEDFNEEAKLRFYELMKRYSFRLFCRDILKKNINFFFEENRKFYSTDSARLYLQEMKKLKLIKIQGGNIELWSNDIKSFGSTLEWFICEIFKREFSTEAIYGVRLKDKLISGDLDVLAWHSGDKLIYVEVKSSPPKYLNSKLINSFLKRVEFLQPELAIFLEDTELRLSDKILPLFENSLKLLSKEKHQPNFHKLLPIKAENYFIEPNIFIINSRPSIITNLQRCIHYYYFGKI